MSKNVAYSRSPEEVGVSSRKLRIDTMFLKLYGRPRQTEVLSILFFQDLVYFNVIINVHNSKTLFGSHNFCYSDSLELLLPTRR